MAYANYIADWGQSFGAGIVLDFIQASASQYNNQKIAVGSTTYNIRTTTSSLTTTFSTIYEETFSFQNNTSQQIKYQFNVRQQFKVYFVNRFEYNYSTQNWGTGLFGLDQNWSYTQNGYFGAETRFFLIPFGQPYFEITECYTNTQGRDIVYNRSNQSIHFA